MVEGFEFGVLILAPLHHGSVESKPEQRKLQPQTHTLVQALSNPPILNPTKP